MLVFAALPADLDVRTDIVAYPTFANFNVNSYLWASALITTFFPLATLALYLLLTSAFIGPLGPWGPIPHQLPHVEEVPAAAGWRRRLVAVGRTLSSPRPCGLVQPVVRLPVEDALPDIERSAGCPPRTTAK